MWQTSENALSRAQQTSERVGGQVFAGQEANRAFARTMALNVNNQDFQKQMATLGFQFGQSNMRLQDAIMDNNAIQEQDVKAYYNRGLSGEVLTDKQLLSLRSNNPGAYAAYQSGKAGETIEKANEKNDLIQNYYNARIVGLDPDSENFDRQLNDISNDLARTLGYGEDFFGAPEKNVKELVLSGKLTMQQAYQQLYGTDPSKTVTEVMPIYPGNIVRITYSDGSTEKKPITKN